MIPFPVILITPPGLMLLAIVVITVIACVRRRWPYVGAALAVVFVVGIVYLRATWPDCMYNCPIG